MMGNAPADPQAYVALSSQYRPEDLYGKSNSNSPKPRHGQIEREKSGSPIDRI